MLSSLFNLPYRVIKRLHFVINDWRIRRTLDRLAPPKWCYECGTQLGENSYYRSVATGPIRMTIRGVRSMCAECAHKEMAGESED